MALPSESLSVVRSERRLVTFSVVMLAVGCLPLVYWHLAQLLARPHYQFILLIPVPLWLLWNSADAPSEMGNASRGRWIGSMVMVMSVLGVGFASFLWSPWIGAVSCLLGIAGIVLATLGVERGKQFFPVWLFSWILIPPPFGLDGDLIVALRDATTSMSSSVLDQLGVFHQRNANVIELPVKQLFIADACSGIHSFYVVIAVALFLALWKHRSIFHLCLLALSGVGFVLLENVARIVVVAVGIGYRRDLSIGFNHALLGVLLFCVSVALVVSMDQLLLFAIPDPPRWLQQWLDFRKENRRSRRKSSSVSSIDLNTKVVLVAASVLFPSLGFVQMFRMPENTPSIVGLLNPQFDLPRFEKEALPESHLGFEIKDYQVVERVFGDPFGQASQQWTFQKGSLNVTVSVDYPYDGLHDLCQCYIQTGWSIPEKSIVTSDWLASKMSIQDEPKFARAVMKREFYGNALLLFSLTDQTGHTDALLKDLAKGNLKNRFEDRILSGKTNEVPKSTIYQPSLPFVQSQMLARSFDPISAEDESQLVQFFLHCRRLLQQKAAVAVKETK